ncbi:endothelin-converting enzyme like protein [Ditylenchus destructor]|nr:endothelin-converting enzyme like protein [Ditylenchus destructor]
MCIVFHKLPLFLCAHYFLLSAKRRRGFHASFRGFQLWKDTVGKEPGLPATSGPLGHLEENQLFFLAQAQTFCSKFPTQDQGDHSPAKYRVRGPSAKSSSFLECLQLQGG